MLKRMVFVVEKCKKKLKPDLFLAHLAKYFDEISQANNINLKRAAETNPTTLNQFSFGWKKAERNFL